MGVNGEFMWGSGHGEYRRRSRYAEDALHDTQDIFSNQDEEEYVDEEFLEHRENLKKFVKHLQTHPEVEETITALMNKVKEVVVPGVDYMASLTNSSKESRVERVVLALQELDQIIFQIRSNEDILKIMEQAKNISLEKRES